LKKLEEVRIANEIRDKKAAEVTRLYNIRVEKQRVEYELQLKLEEEAINKANAIAEQKKIEYEKRETERIQLEK